MGLRRLQARGGADGAVHIGGRPARAADHVMVVVSDADLEASRAPSRLDPADELAGGERVEDIVGGLDREAANRPAGLVEDGRRVRVRVVDERVQNREPRRGHAEPGAPQQLGMRVVPSRCAPDRRRPAPPARLGAPRCPPLGRSASVAHGRQAILDSLQCARGPSLGPTAD